MMPHILRFFPKMCVAIAGCIYLFTLGIFQKKHRDFIYQMAVHFGWNRSGTTARLPVCSIESVLSPELELKILKPAPQGGNVTLTELIILTDLAKSRKVTQIFEIGTFDGRTAVNLAAATNENAKIYTLDLPESQINETRFDLAKDEESFVRKEEMATCFQGYSHEKKITRLFGDSGNFDFSRYEGLMDMVFIDGSHAAEYVKTDTATALKLLKSSGGLIFWHDYLGHWPELTQTLNELNGQDPRLSGMQSIEGTSLVILELPKIPVRLTTAQTHT